MIPSVAFVLLLLELAQQFVKVTSTIKSQITYPCLNVLISEDLGHDAAVILSKPLAELHQDGSSHRSRVRDVGEYGSRCLSCVSYRIRGLPNHTLVERTAGRATVGRRSVNISSPVRLKLTSK